MLKEKTRQIFQKQFDSEPTHFFQAPGRVNLIGEHTDYNDGFVLPCAINYQVMIAAQPLPDDSHITVVAADYQEEIDKFSLKKPITPAAPWSNYVRGVVWSFLQRGYPLTGARFVIAGNIPQGAGLSSSAALEVATGYALSHLNDLNLAGETLARIGQQAENDFVGVNCGVMDQFISAMGQEGHALLLDCRDLSYRQVPIPPGWAIVVMDSRVQRGLVESEYNLRRQECEMAAEHFGVPALRDVPPDLFALHEDALPETVAKRARHVITENARTEAAADALAQADMSQLSFLMAESHASMRDDFEITVPPIDALVEIVRSVVGKRGGVRMTGGGFGGCVVALVPQERVSDLKTAIAEQYPTTSEGLTAQIYLCRASAGAGVC